jgi:hypothetical protein
MLIPDPDFCPSWIPDLESRTQKQEQKIRVKKNCCPIFFVATNITKLKIILCLNRRWANLLRIEDLFTEKIVLINPPVCYVIAKTKLRY